MDYQDKIADIETKISFASELLVHSIHELKGVKDELRKTSEARIGYLGTKPEGIEEVSGQVL